MPPTNIWIVLFFTFCWLSVFSQSTNGSFLINHWTINEGLSDNEVNCLLQDRYGYIWIGTNDGLNRFDGYHFTTFHHQPGSSNSLSNNKINVLLEDRNGFLWIGTQNGINRFDPITETFQRFLYQPEEAGSLGHNIVRALWEDQLGSIWLGTDNGLSLFEPEKQTFTNFQHQYSVIRPWETKPTQEVSALGETHDGKFLVGFWGAGLMVFDQTNHQFRRVQIEGIANEDKFLTTVEGICNTQWGETLVTANGKVYVCEPSGGLKEILPTRNQSIRDIGVLVGNDNEEYLLGGYHGLLVTDRNFKEIARFEPAKPNYENVRHNHVITVLLDRAGDIWVGTRGKGLFHLNARGNYFSNFSYEARQPNSIPQNFISALLEIEQDLVWVGTRRRGISVLNRRTNTFEQLPSSITYPKGLNTNEISVLLQDRQKNIWMGTWGGGVNLYRPKDQEFQYFFKDNFHNETKLPDNYITAILETREGEIWVGTVLGLGVLKTAKDIKNGTFKRYKTLPGEEVGLNSYRVLCIYQTSEGRILVGTDKGLLIYQREQDNFLHLIQQPDNINSLGNNTVHCIFEDKDQNLWIGTAGGLDQFDPERKTFVHFSEEQGLKDGFIVGITQDKQGYLWLAGKKGFSRFDPVNQTFKYFDKGDGLLNNKFSRNAFITSEYTGTIYAGGEEGLSIFHPDSIRDNDYEPPVIISGIKKYVTTGKKMGETIIHKMGGIDRIELSYRDNIVTFELSALNFRNAQKNQFAYQLEGFSDQWIQNGTKREITFTNLDPGHYTLRVKASNNDGVWNNTGASLKIRITPPWWATWWAYGLYFVFLSGMTYGIYQSLHKRWLLKIKLREEQEEAQRLKELDGYKSRLYTNLTHEFRTPLTVILGMARQIRKEPKKFWEQGTQLIETHSTSLLRLINQLLDLSKLENQALSLQLKQSNIVQYLRFITESYQTFANNKNLSLRFFAPFQSLVMDFDPHQVKQLMDNLISNAIKFTPSGGDITVSLRMESHFLYIEIKDTGIGIHKKDLHHIFDRFYQADGSTTRKREGTGIGLAHTKELVRLMSGTISVESILHQGTLFIIKLPIHNQAPEWEVPTPFFPSMNIPKPTLLSSEETNGQPKESTLPQLLIIEDNPDVVFYLKSCLVGLYQIDVAYNGRIGIEKALENIPDLIICDVMMPEKNGYQVCQSLKTNEQTSHIPIILLTAKADTNSKLSGLRRGADAYLAKPFDLEELLIRLDRLVDRQKRMRAHFRTVFGQAAMNGQTDQVDEADVQIEDAFIRRVIEIVEENYQDAHFSLPMLCKKVGMSRSQLFRKMKALINTSPSAFIRDYRLNKAKTLLETTQLTVSEIAWKVGFKDPSHFTKSFQEAFGFLPSATNK